ncbi:hypothetical protein BH10PSE7_BH10PSE7_12350 [soil metagenome]
MKGAFLMMLTSISLMTTAANAEYRSYVHGGCTKDGAKVSEAVVWDCHGACKATPLKATIIKEAAAIAQIKSRAHVNAVLAKAEVKSKLTANPPKFGGKC